MSNFWSLWIALITFFTIAAVSAILYWASKNNTDIKEGEDMGHEYDGIRELNNPLPKWWLYMFIGTIVFSLFYLALFPGLGNFKGLLGWQSSDQTVKNMQESKEAIEQAQKNQHLNQYARELDQADVKFSELFKSLAQDGDQFRPIETIAENQDAVKVGQRLFLQNCAQCHGSDARGQAGFPNLTDQDWLYGGEAETIKATVMHGRQGEMPAWGDMLGEQGVEEVTSYVLSLSGRKVNTKDAFAGKQKFAVCASCHGTGGTGNPAFGAPDLTDNTWLYGGSRRDVQDTIMYGRQGMMPAWDSILGEKKVQLISAYVWQLSQEKTVK